MKIQSAHRKLLYAACGFVFCALFQTTVEAQVGVPPKIITDLLDKVVLIEDSVTFRVTASSATSMSYKWYHDSNLISGATSTNYTIANVNSEDAGYYQVAVSNAAGTTLSRIASMAVFPSNDIPVANNDVFASGVLGMTASVPGVLTNDVDFYPGTLSAVKVTNPSHGSVSLSTNGSFSYSPDLLYTGVDSFTYRVKDGGTTILEQNSSGGNKQEIKNSDPGAQSFSHGTSGDPTYSVKKVILRLSKKSSQTNNLNFSIGTGTNSGTISGSSYTISMSSISNTTEGASFQNYEIVYATPVGPLSAGATYYLNFSNSPNGGEVYVELTSNSTYSKGTFYKGGSDQSKDMKFEIHDEAVSGAATVTIYVGLLPVSPVILTQPANQQVILGASAQFSVTLADSLAAPSFQWRFNGTNIPNAQASSYVITNVQAENVGNYSVKVTNLGGSTNSADAALSIDTTALAMSSPTQISHDFKFRITGPQKGTYIVYFSTNLSTWTPIATNEITNGSWAFSDANTFSATNTPLRLYKVRVTP